MNKERDKNAVAGLSCKPTPWHYLHFQFGLPKCRRGLFSTGFVRRQQMSLDWEGCCKKPQQTGRLLLRFMQLQIEIKNKSGIPEDGRGGKKVTWHSIGSV